MHPCGQPVVAGVDVAVGGGDVFVAVEGTRVSVAGTLVGVAGTFVAVSFASVGVGGTGVVVGFRVAVAVLAIASVGVSVALGVVFGLDIAVRMTVQANNRTSKPPQTIKSLPPMPDFQSWVMRFIVCLFSPRLAFFIKERYNPRSRHTSRQ
jgi:hypothetical protein